MKRTTLVLEPSLYAELKRRAAAEGRTLTDVVERALRLGLDGPGTARRPRVTLPSYDLGPFLVSPAERGAEVFRDRSREVPRAGRGSRTAGAAGDRGEAAHAAGRRGAARGAEPNRAGRRASRRRAGGHPPADDAVGAHGPGGRAGGTRTTADAEPARPIDRRGEE